MQDNPLETNITGAAQKLRTGLYHVDIWLAGNVIASTEVSASSTKDASNKAINKLKFKAHKSYV